MLDSEVKQSREDPPQENGASLWSISLILFALSLIFALTVQTYTDPDLWGHLQFGLDLVDAGVIVTNDPYSYVTAGQFWVNHEWLTEALMAAAWLPWEVSGLILLRLSVFGLTLALVAFHLVKILKLETLVVMFVLVITTLGLMPFTVTVRPQLFTFLLFAATLLIIYLAEQRRYRWLWLMPLLVAAWVNLHGGFLAGCGILGLWSIAHMAAERSSWRAVLPPLLASAAATLVNPYGVHLLIFLLHTATGTRPEITDWQPLGISSFMGPVYLLTLAIALAALYYSRRPRSFRLLGIFALCSLMPLVAVRHMPLMSLALAFLVSEHIGSTVARFSRLQTSAQRPAALSAVLFLIAAISIGIGVLRNSPTQILLFDAPRYPDAAVKLLQTNKVSGNLATHFNWGEYLIWHLGPELRVSIDGRRETVYTPAIYTMNQNFAAGFSEWDQLLREYPTDLALVHAGGPTANLLKLYPGWSLVYEDEVSALFVNDASAVAETVRRAAVNFVAPPPQKFFP